MLADKLLLKNVRLIQLSLQFQGEGDLHLKNI